MSETLIVVHTQGMTYTLQQARSGAPGGSVYGGASPLAVSGGAFGPAPLHHVASLSPSDFPQLGDQPLPLLYGFQFSGCELRYGVEPQALRVLSLDPQESSDDWPYENYPTLLPRLALEVAQTQAESWEDFSDRYPNLPGPQPADLVALIPPPAQIGMSLWGPDGDDEEVCVVCECDLATRQVKSYNICS